MPASRGHSFGSFLKNSFKNILIYHYFIPKNTKESMGSNYESENFIYKHKKWSEIELYLYQKK